MTAKQLLDRKQQRMKMLQRELGRVGPVMRGSVVIIGSRNKQPYFSLNKDKKTRLIYLGKVRERMARQYVANYQRLKNIVEEMTELNMVLLQRDYDQVN